MGNKVRFLILALLLGYGIGYAQVKESMYGDAVNVEIKVNYVFSYEDALKEARSTHKPVFFNCFSDWAIPCHTMNQYVFSNKEFCDWLNEHFVNLWIEMTTEDGQVLAGKYGVKSMPYFLVLDENGEVIHRLASGAELPEFKERLEYALNAKTSYRGMNEAYKKGARSKKFLRNYALVLRWAGEEDRYNQISDLYFNKLKRSEWSDEGNWQIYTDRMRRPDSLLIDYLLDHKADFVKHNGEDAVDHMILTLYYADAMSLAMGGKAYDRALALEIFSRLHKAEIPDTNEVYRFLEIASLRHAEKYEEMIDYLMEYGKDIHPRVRKMLDMSLGNLHELSPKQQDCIIAYLEKRKKEETDEYSRNHYENLIKGIRDFKGIVFERLSLDEALEKAKANGKEVFVDCYTSWCGPCKMMESRVFSQEIVGTYCNQHYVNIKIDMEKGEGPEVAERYGVEAYPTMLVLDPDGTVKCRMTGSRDVNNFLMVLKRSENKDYDYSRLVREYENGNRTPAFLSRYYLVMSDAGKLANGNELMRFLSSLKDEDRYSREIWDLYNLLAFDVQGEAFAFIMNHREEFVKVLGENDVDKALEQIVFPVYVDYLVSKEGLDKLERCRELVKTGSLPSDNTLVLLDNLVKCCQDEDFESMLGMYENRVSQLQNSRSRLNLDALLPILVREAPRGIQERALVYIKGSQAKTDANCSKLYENLINELSRSMEMKTGN